MLDEIIENIENDINNLKSTKTKLNKDGVDFFNIKYEIYKKYKLLLSLKQANKENKKLIHHTFIESKKLIKENKTLMKKIDYVKNHTEWVISDAFIENMEKIK